jgi:phospholipid-binding lipoprotein MlaA
VPSRLTTVSGFAIAMALAMTAPTWAETSATAAPGDAAASPPAAPAATPAPAAAAPAAAAPAVAAAEPASPWDPLEDLNRATFNFNAAWAKDIGDPVAAAYQSAVPQAAQTGIGDFFTNLREPVTAVSSGLQGDFQNAGVSATRFAINTTVGVLGVFDVATDMGWVSRPEDIGAMLCAYGIRPGPYFVVPILGPSNARDAVGSLVSFYALGSAIGGDETVNYLIADRVAARLSDKQPAAAASTGDAYAAQRDAYLAFRDEVCKRAIPANQLKPSPFGSVAARGKS